MVTLDTTNLPDAVLQLVDTAGLTNECRLYTTQSGWLAVQWKPQLPEYEINNSYTQ